MYLPATIEGIPDRRCGRIRSRSYNPLLKRFPKGFLWSFKLLKPFGLCLVPPLQPQFPLDGSLAFVVRTIEVFEHRLELLFPLLYNFEGTLTANLHALSLVLVFLRCLYNELFRLLLLWRTPQMLRLRRFSNRLM